VSAFALTQASVFAVFRDGTAAALDAGDLSLSWQWPGAPDRTAVPSRDRREAAPPVCVAAGGASAVAILGKSLFRFELAGVLGESRPAAATADPSQR
jgi:hypothetical protein